MQPQDKNVLINRSKSLVEKFVMFFVVKRLMIGNEYML